MKGQIVKIHSDLHYVQYEQQLYPCKCRGAFRKEKILPLVGDFVEFDCNKCVIEKIYPRKNEFFRPKVSNIDQAFIITSLVSPMFSLNLLDKLLVLMELHSVCPIICITKRDLVPEEDFQEIEKILDYYKKIGYTVIYNTELDKIKELLKDKTSVFTGQTGAGKSTLLNKIDKNLKLNTDEVSYSLGRGKHTTRLVELMKVKGGFIADTPGFSSLDLNIERNELKHTFPDFNYVCKYKSCNHVSEDGCEVIKAVKNGKILKSRYENYLKLLKEIS